MIKIKAKYVGKVTVNCEIPYDKEKHLPIEEVRKNWSSLNGEISKELKSWFGDEAAIEVIEQESDIQVSEEE